MRSKRLLAIVFSTAAFGALAAAPAAHAVFSLTPQVEFTTNPIAVGSTGSGTISFDNDSSVNEDADVERLVLEPSCKNAGEGPPCTNRDDGVFTISNGTGAPGTACAGKSFTAAPGTAPFVGAVEFTPTTALNVLKNQTCLINFTYTALKIPTFNTQPAEPGINTDQSALVRAEFNGGGGTDFGPATDFTAVSPAPAPVVPIVAAPAPGPTASGQQAAALAKCKKKKSKKAKKKCRKKAAKLPS